MASLTRSRKLNQPLISSFLCPRFDKLQRFVGCVRVQDRKRKSARRILSRRLEALDTLSNILKNLKGDLQYKLFSFGFLKEGAFVFFNVVFDF